MTTLGRVSSSDGGAPDRPQVWRTLALVYLATNARYGSGLLKRRTQRVMSREEREVIHGILERVPPAVASWSHGNAAMHPFDVVEVRSAAPFVVVERRRQLVGRAAGLPG